MGGDGDGDDDDRWASARHKERRVVRQGLQDGSVRTTERSVVFHMRRGDEHGSALEAHTSDPRTLSTGRDVDTADTASGSTSVDGEVKHARLANALGAEASELRPVEDAEVNETLMELYADVERNRQWLFREDEAFRVGQERMELLKREYQALKEALVQAKVRKRKRAKAERLLHGPRSESDDGGGESDSSSDSAGDSGSDEDAWSHRRYHRLSRRRKSRDGSKKERKRLRRLRKDLSLRFQLLQSECRRTDLHAEKLMADLRREYADTCLFGNSLPLSFP